MSSEKRILASRANGARSRGPKTPEGKARSSRNATHHGVLSKCLLINGERPEDLQELLDQYTDRFRPNDGVELGLVEEMVAAAWRMRRNLAFESEMLDGADPDSPPRNDLYDRYQTHLHLIRSRALRDIAFLRDVIEGPPQNWEIVYVKERSSNRRNEPENSFPYNKTAEISAQNEPARNLNEPGSNLNEPRTNLNEPTGEPDNPTEDPEGTPGPSSSSL